MKDAEKLKQLNSEIADIEKRMSNCKHTFTKPIYDIEMVREGYGSVQDGAGSDPHWSYAGYRNVEKSRWSRECTICGKKEYTYELKDIVVGKEPKF